MRSAIRAKDGAAHDQGRRGRRAARKRPAALRARPRPQRGELRAAVARRLPRAQRAASIRTRSRCVTGASRIRTASSTRAAAGWLLRSRAAASARGDTVAMMAPNIPALLEAHYAVPALGAVLNALNVRLDARTLAVLPRPRRSESALDRRRIRAGDASEALALLRPPDPVVDLDDQEGPGTATQRPGRVLTYETCSPKATRRSRGRVPATNGTRSRCCTRRARPAIPKASSTTIAAPTSTRSGNALAFRLSGRTACTCGRCRCSIAAAGRTPGP